MMEPPPFASMPGRNALIVRCMDFTLRSKAKSHSSSVQSSTVPWCTKPAALNSTSTAPNRLACASIALASRASSFTHSAMPAAFSSPNARIIDVAGDDPCALAGERDGRGAADAGARKPCRTQLSLQADRPCVILPVMPLWARMVACQGERGSSLVGGGSGRTALARLGILGGQINGKPHGQGNRQRGEDPLIGQRRIAGARRAGTTPG